MYHDGKKKMMGGGRMQYGHGSKVKKDGNKTARNEYSKGGSVSGAMKTAKPC